MRGIPGVRVRAAGVAADGVACMRAVFFFIFSEVGFKNINEGLNLYFQKKNWLLESSTDPKL